MKFLLIFLFFFYQSIFSQELSSTVFINSDNIETSDKYIFEEMNNFKIYELLNPWIIHKYESY